MKLITTQQSDDDIIRKHLQGKLERSELSEAVEKQVEEMLVCEKLMRKYVSRSEVCPMLQQALNCSQTKAYRLYDRTQKLFGESGIKDQQFWLDIELGELEKDIRAARALKDYRSVAALRKIKSDYIKNMGSGDALLYEKIQPPPFVVGFFPRSMMVTLPKDRELKQLVSEKLKKIAEDVGYEESGDSK